MPRQPPRQPSTALGRTRLAKACARREDGRGASEGRSIAYSPVKCRRVNYPPIPTEKPVCRGLSRCMNYVYAMSPSQADPLIADGSKT